eukprot:COSAG01_NODE_5583_length_4164_cov_29.982042_2_plen_873_part_00
MRQQGAIIYYNSLSLPLLPCDGLLRTAARSTAMLQHPPPRGCLTPLWLPPMRCYCCRRLSWLLLLLLAATTTTNANVWTGPSVRPDLSGAVAALRIGGDNHGSDSSAVVLASWPTLSPNYGLNGEDSVLIAEQSARVGMHVIEVEVSGVLPNRTSPMDSTLLGQWRRVIRAAPNATVIVRVSLYDMVDEGVVLQSTQMKPGNNSGPCGGGPSSGSGACVFTSVVTDSSDGKHHADDRMWRKRAGQQCSCQRMNTPASKAWIAFEQERLAAHLEYMDQLFPGKIGGVHLTSMHSGEFYYPGWDAVGHYDHMYGDYSEAARVSFCGNKSDVVCTLPSARERNRPVELPGGGKNNVFVSGNAARANVQLSKNIAEAVTAFCQTAKRVSGGKLLTMAFYGYLMGLSDWRVTGSGQLTASSVIDDASIDAYVAPYMYDAFSRTLSGAMLPIGPWDSPALRGKLFVQEDDTRLSLTNESVQCGGVTGMRPYCRSSWNSVQDVDIMRRNILAWSSHKNAGYAFGHYFGHNAQLNATRTLWNGIASALAVVRRALAAPLPPRLPTNNYSGMAATLQPEVVAFVDDHSAAYMKLTGPACVNDEWPRHRNSTWDNPNGFAATLLGEPTLQQLHMLGAPLRIHYLRDILQPSFPDTFRLALMLNAHVVPADIATALRQKLMQRNTTVVWLYAGAVINEHGTFQDGGLARTFPEQAAFFRNIRRHISSAETKLTAELLHRPHDRFGSGCSVAPAFYFANDSAAAEDGFEILGRYAEGALAGRVSFVRSGKHVFSGTPALPGVALRELAGVAGVHAYVGAPDLVDVMGSVLVVHAAASTGMRHVVLPQILHVENEAGDIVCARCASFDVLLRNGSSAAFFVSNVR